MTRRLTLLAVLLCVTSALQPIATPRVFGQAADLTADFVDWPRWRGPRADGVASDRDLPLEWSETKNVRWVRTSARTKNPTWP